MENKLTPEEFRNKFDEETAKIIHSAGVFDFLVRLRLNTDDITFNKIKSDIVKEIEAIRSQIWYKQLSEIAVIYNSELKAMLKKYECFIKTPEQLSEMGKKGGKRTRAEKIALALSILKGVERKFSSRNLGKYLTAKSKEFGKPETFDKNFAIAHLKEYLK